MHHIHGHGIFCSHSGGGIEHYEVKETDTDRRRIKYSLSTTAVSAVYQLGRDVAEQSRNDVSYNETQTTSGIS